MEYPTLPGTQLNLSEVWRSFLAVSAAIALPAASSTAGPASNCKLIDPRAEDSAKPKTGEN